MRGIDYGHNYEDAVNHNRALEALAQMKALEAERKEYMTTVKVNRHKVSCTGEHEMERTIKYIKSNW